MRLAILKKNTVIKFASLIFLFVLLSPTLVSAAACQWEVLTISSSPSMIGGGTTYSGGCKANQGYTQDNTGGCAGITKPETTSMLGQMAICCCQPKSGASVPSKAPKFEIPDLQVSLTGLTLTQPKCVQGTNGEYTCKVNWLGEYITWIYNYALKVAGILAAIVMMAGGVMWLISGGDAGKVGQAKEMIIGSITGLIILFSSYLLLIQINPDLVNFRPITIGALSDQQVSSLIDSKNGGLSDTYRNANCATDQELKNGVDFYATGYCRPTWADTKKFYCAIAMNCSCPGGDAGVDTSQNCDEFFPKFKNYHPCKPFTKDTSYCNATKSGTPPGPGTIAGPIKCGNLSLGDKVCFNGKNYTITDSGGAIEGKRIDIWTGDCSGASSVTGTGVLTKGACGTGPAIIYNGTFNTTGWSFDPGIINQAGDASQNLGQLLNCMRSRLPAGVGTISSISDSNYIGKLAQCNKADCGSVIPCVHSCSSCHYGGGDSSNKSYAVDFGDEKNKNAIQIAAYACDPNAYVLDEGNHIHVSASACRKK
jgi:hypothetical protein